MTISVIGGAGFIGTYLCDMMANAGVPFEIIDIKQSKRFPAQTKIADIRDLDALREAVTGDVIVNLAAVHRDDIRDRSLYYQTNVDGTRNTCVLASERGINRIVFTSSVAVYGFAPKGTDENGDIDPFNDYGKSKYQAEEVLRDWYETRGGEKSLSIVRPTVVFGPGNRGNVYNLLNQVRSGLFMMVGNGRNVKSMAYVENIATFLFHISKFQSGYRLLNYVDKPDLDMNHLVSLIRRALKGREGTGPRVPRSLALAIGYMLDGIAKVSGRTFPLSAIRVRKFCADTDFSSAAHDVEGFTAPVSLKEGLGRTLQKEFIAPDLSMGIFFTE